MSNVIDLAAYRAKRLQNQSRDLRKERPVWTSRQYTPTSSFFVTAYQILIKPRKDEQ